MDTAEQLQEMQGKTLVDRVGDEVGEVESTHPDPEGDGPGWLTVKTGLLGRNLSFIPADGVEERDGALHAEWDKTTVKDAPAPEVDENGGLSDDDRYSLRTHYTVGRESNEAAPEQPDDVPVTHDEDSDLRDPEKGDRRGADEMVRPEVIHGIRPKDSDDIDSSKEKLDASPPEERTDEG